jgi:hypothetical protein
VPRVRGTLAVRRDQERVGAVALTTHAGSVGTVAGRGSSRRDCR